MAVANFFLEDNVPLTGPTVRITSPAPEANFVTNVPEVWVEGIARRGTKPIQSGEYRVNGQSFHLTADEDGHFDFNAADLIRGFNTITVTVRDEDGFEDQDETKVYYASGGDAFLITLEPSILTLEEGESDEKETKLRLWSTTLDIEDVAFTSTGAPDEVEVSFDPTGTKTNNKNSKFVLDIGAGVESGVHLIQVQTTAGTKTSRADLTLVVGPSVPLVQIVSPLPETTVTEPSVKMTVQVGWTTFVDIAYRLKKDDPWNVVADGVWQDQPHIFEVTGLMEGPNTVEVKASDFVSPELSASDSIKIYYRPDVSNNAPKIGITAPSDGNSFDEGTDITFEATASDQEDGDLSNAIEWNSDLSGALGTGATVTTQLSVGTHTVTAKVTDSDGVSSQDNVTVKVSKKEASGYELALTVGGSNDGSVSIGNPAFITLGVKHNGNNAASGVQVTHLLPEGFTFDKVDAISHGTYNSSTGIWNIGAMQPNTTASLQIRAIAAKEGTWTNTAEITAGLAAGDDTRDNKGSISFIIVK